MSYTGPRRTRHGGLALAKPHLLHIVCARVCVCVFLHMWGHKLENSFIISDGRLGAKAVFSSHY